MDDAVGGCIGILILGALAIAAIVAVAVFLGMVLLWVIGISAGVGVLSGMTLSLKAPFTYFDHLWKRCK